MTYAGWSGSYGNFIKIDHGGGVSTGYAHIRPGGLFVGYGQWVSAGQQIAASGTTGASTGCHLHFEVYDGWSRINPRAVHGRTRGLPWLSTAPTDLARDARHGVLDRGRRRRDRVDRPRRLAGCGRARLPVVERDRAGQAERVDEAGRDRPARRAARRPAAVGRMPRCRPRRWPTRRGGRRSMPATGRRSASARSGAQADEADAVAEISKMRAGLLAAHLARTAGNDLGSELMFGSADAAAADGLLRQLGMATKLGEQSQGVYEQAIARPQRGRCAARAGRRGRRRSANGWPEVAEQRADEARSAADAALSAVADAEVRSTELYAQLAALKDTTADLERDRAEGIAREAAEEALRRAQEQELADEQARAEAEQPVPPKPRDRRARVAARRRRPGARVTPPRASPGPRRTRARSRRPSGSRGPARRALSARRRRPERLGLLGPHQGGIRRSRHRHRHPLGDEPVLHPRRSRQGRVARPASSAATCSSGVRAAITTTSRSTSAADASSRPRARAFQCASTSSGARPRRPPPADRRLTPAAARTRRPRTQDEGPSQATVADRATSGLSVHALRETGQ